MTLLETIPAEKTALPMRSVLSSAERAVCVTLYNEPLADLLRTLTSLADAFAYSGSTPQTDARTVICIVCDGVEKMDGEVLSFLNDESFLTPDPEVIDDGIELHARLPSPVARLKLGSDHAAAPFHILTCVQMSNRGKLHSHSIFFGHVCAMLEPEYCYQVDAGTIVSRDSFAVIEERFRKCPEVAAIAPKVTLHSMEDSFLATWQHFDFAMRNEILWPIEVLTGHLSVIPGQASALRWSALKSGERGKRPLDAYLRGPDPGRATDRIKYLAEDRVIGNQIVQLGRGWRLDFTPGVTVATDQCGTYSELFRQRRRWINSAAACRLATLLHALAKPKSGKAGVRASIVLTHALMLLAEFLAPAQLAFLACGLLMLAETGRGAILIGVAAVSAIGAAVVFALQAKTRAKGRGLASVCDAFALITVLALYVAVADRLGLLAAALLGSPVVAGLVLARATGPTTWRTLVRAQFFLWSNLVFGSALVFHALFNLPDVSWGTKGLRSSDIEAALRQRLLRFRAAVFAIWALANLAATYGLVAALKESGLALMIVLGSLGWIALILVLANRVWERLRWGTAP